MSASKLYTSPNGPTYILPLSLYDYFVSQPGGEPERPLIDWVKDNFLHPEWAFVDVGAHVGTYTLHFAPKARAVYAFEPQRSTFHRLCGGIALAGHDHVHAHHAALTDRAGTATLKKQYDDGGLSTIAGGIPHAEHYPEEQVTVATLDSYGLEKVGLMKLDVEGSELSVLAGARETLKRSGWPRLLIEVWQDDWFRDRREAVKAELERLGYGFEGIRHFSHMWLAVHPGTTVKP